MHVDLNKDYFTESSRSALKAVFASWSLEQCRLWYALWLAVFCCDNFEYVILLSEILRNYLIKSIVKLWIAHTD